MKESRKIRLVRFFAQLLRPLGLSVYGWPMAANTATVVVFFDGGKRVLAIKRKHNPHKGKYAFPGGFLEVGEETLLDCAARELFEETRIKALRKEQFRLCDVRSAPDRDPRGVVIDTGYFVVVPDDQREQVMQQLHAATPEETDDAEGFAVFTIDEVQSSGLAFDHELLLAHALEAAGFAGK